MGKKSHILGLCVKIKKIDFKAQEERNARAEGKGMPAVALWLQVRKKIHFRKTVL